MFMKRMEAMITIKKGMVTRFEMILAHARVTRMCKEEDNA